MTPQERFQIDVILLKGPKLWGIASGNYASWHCVCLAERLMGCSSEDPVVCTHCDRTYRIEGNGNLSRVIRVVEIAREPVTTPVPEQDNRIERIEAKIDLIIELLQRPGGKEEQKKS
jgi:hypothetical protein